MQRRSGSRKVAVVGAVCLISSAALLPGASAAGPPAHVDCATPDLNRFDHSELAVRPSRFGAESNALFTCTVRDANGQLVGSGQTVWGESWLGSVNDPDDGNFYATPDYSCTTGANGACAVTVTQSEGHAGTATICFFVDFENAINLCQEAFAEAPDTDDVDAADNVRVRWEDRNAASRGGLDVEPETATRERGTKHRITARVYDQFGYGYGPAVLGFEFYSGSPHDLDGTTPETPDRRCRTDSGGWCSISIRSTSEALGRDRLCVWMDNGLSVGMSGNNQDGTCGGVAGIDEAHDTPGGYDAPEAEGDLRDAVEVSWQRPGPAGGGVDVEPESASVEAGQTHTFTAQVFDSTGTPFTGTAVVNFELFSGSPTDRDGNTPQTPDLSCTAVDASTCVLTYKAGGAGTDRLCAWTGTAPSMAGTNGGGTCNGEDLTDPPDSPGSFQAPDPADDDVDVVTVRWVKTKPGP